jgi:hypothetical protein
MTKPHSGQKKPALVTIRTFATESEAMVAKAALEGSGIECTLSGDDYGGLQPALAMTRGIRLVVRSGDAERAEEALSDRRKKSKRG